MHTPRGILRSRWCRRSIHETVRHHRKDDCKNNHKHTTKAPQGVALSLSPRLIVFLFTFSASVLKLMEHLGPMFALLLVDHVMSRAVETHPFSASFKVRLLVTARKYRFNMAITVLVSLLSAITYLTILAIS